MAKAPERASVLGPAFIRQLTRLTDVDVPHTTRVPTLTERLSQWFDWNRAVALSRALDGQPSVAAGEPIPAADAQRQDCTRVRGALSEAIRADREFAAPAAVQDLPAPPDSIAMPAEADFSRLRRRYLDHQRAMQAATGRLRGQLRDMLARQSEQQARLAEVDAVMELTLSAREQTLLATVPNLLNAHFERLRDAAQQAFTASDETPDVPAAASGAWLAVVRNDMQRLLLAELDVRFQPIEALLAALRPQSPGSHV
ncbi:DUF3348 domain-containing protein [Pseudoxanthomonas sp.]|uniref:DUF3348 domain-containing protein n=1 Tax=Pseudoxanthomonas sp. TaxID=1871049 RepID=UPI002614BFBB|nr:DUF3348 domain-containing protein [Pseudoxanthomonas sp.]WDS37766.1 MAG: DUF3348 domain-containing protein [Pseudoxanthomonas sp.]